MTAGQEGQKAAAGRRPQGASADHRAAILMVALAAVVHMLRSRRFYQRMITVAIAVGALRRIGQENQASTMARLAAWDKRQVQRLKRKAKRQGRVIKRKAKRQGRVIKRKAKRQGRVIKGAEQMMRSDAPRHLAPRDGA